MYPPITARAGPGLHFISSFNRLSPSYVTTFHFRTSPLGQSNASTSITLRQYLRIYCNYEQDNRSKLLPLAEFAYNNAPRAPRAYPHFSRLEDMTR